MRVTAEQMAAARLDVAFRDHCAHMLIPLNACRADTKFLPWKCTHERHEYERCQYEEYVLREGWVGGGGGLGLGDWSLCLRCLTGLVSI